MQLHHIHLYGIQHLQFPTPNMCYGVWVGKPHRLRPPGKRR